MEAILNNVRNTAWLAMICTNYYTFRYTEGKRNYQFKRRYVPWTNLRLTDDRLKEVLDNPERYREEHKAFGYWNIKRVELKWHEVI